mgnify:CR=1 FL=1
MNTLAHRPLWLVVGYALALLIAVLSLAPTSQLPEVDYNDKLGHLLAYGGLMAWFGQLYRRRLGPALALFGFGAGLEVLQGASGYRDMSGLDLVANATGIGLGWLATLIFPNWLAGLERVRA